MMMMANIIIKKGNGNVYRIIMTAGKFRLDTDGDIVVFYIGKL